MSRRGDLALLGTWFDVLPVAWAATEPEPVKPSPLDLAVQAGITPDPWQARLLQSTAQRILLNCSRQSGKSTMTAVLAVHTAITEPDSLVLIVSRAERQSQQLMKKAKQIFRRLGRPVAVEGESVLQIRLTNGSEMIALPGKEDSIRSYSGVRLLCLDEASRVPDETYMAVRPMLAASRGRLIALSTPFGTRGWWYEAWMSGEAWERYEIPAQDVPRFDAEFLDEERRAMGSWWFEQEYLCQFKQPSDTPFNLDAVDAAFSPAVLPLFGTNGHRHEPLTGWLEGMRA